MKFDFRMKRKERLTMFGVDISMASGMNNPVQGEYHGVRVDRERSKSVGFAVQEMSFEP